MFDILRVLAIFAGRLGAHASYFYQIFYHQRRCTLFESARFWRATQIEVVIEIVTKIEIESESESEIETQICCIQLSIITRKFFFSAYSYLSVFKSVFL